MHPAPWPGGHEVSARISSTREASGSRDLPSESDAEAEAWHEARNLERDCWWGVCKWANAGARGSGMGRGIVGLRLDETIKLFQKPKQVFNNLWKAFRKVSEQVSGI